MGRTSKQRREQRRENARELARKPQYRLNFEQFLIHQLEYWNKTPFWDALKRQEFSDIKTATAVQIKTANSLSARGWNF